MAFSSVAPARLIDLRQGEGALVVRSAFVLFTLIAGHTLLETARDSLFLTTLPPSRLTLVYLALAALAFVAARFSTGFAERFGRRPALLVTLGIAALGSVHFAFLPVEGPVVFALYLWTGLFGTVAVVQFWMLSGYLFTLAQGKRLFGPIAAGGVAGAVAGAALALLLLQHLAVEKLLYVAAALFVIAAFVLSGYPTEEPIVPGAGRNRTGLSEGMQRIRSESYLRRLALLIGLGAAGLLWTDYLFKLSAAHFIAPNDLPTFFAWYYLLLNGLALVVQLFVASRVIARAGVLSALVILPALILTGGASILLLGGTLVAVLFTKGADGALRHSLYRIASELLWLPLPEQLRARSKEFVDGFVVRFSQALTAAVIFGLTLFELDSVPVLAGGATIVAGAWIVLGVALKKPYLGMFRQALSRTAEYRERLELSLDSIGAVVEALSNPEQEQALAAIDLLVSHDRQRLIPALVLYHPSERVVIAGLSAIARAGRKDWLPIAENLLKHPSENLRAAVMGALVDQGVEVDLSERLADPSPLVRAQALFLIAQDEPGPLDVDDICDRLRGVEAEGTAARLALLSAVAARGDQRWADWVHLCAGDPDVEIRAAAALAMAKVHDDRFIALLIGMLGDRATRPAAREALVAHGAPALERLAKSFADPSFDSAVRTHLPRTVSRFGTQQAADILIERLQQERDGLVRYKVLRGLGGLVTRNSVRVESEILETQITSNLKEYLKLFAYHWAIRPEVVAESQFAAKVGEPLRGLLLDKTQQALERSLRLLQMIHTRENLRSVTRALRTGDGTQRANALEFLDAMTLAHGSEVRKLVTLIVDDMEPAERVDRAREFVGEIPDPRRALLELSQDDDAALAGLAHHYVRRLGGLPPVPTPEGTADLLPGVGLERREPRLA